MKRFELRVFSKSTAAIFTAHFFNLAALLLIFSSTLLYAKGNEVYEIKSPDGKIVMQVTIKDKVEWSLLVDGKQALLPSEIAMSLDQGITLGEKAKIKSAKEENVATKVHAINYIKSSINDEYNQLTVTCKGDYGLVFRVYNDAAAYRFFCTKLGELVVKDETANFNFSEDCHAFLPFMHDYRDNQKFNSSFEALYHEIALSQFPADSLAFLPALVSVTPSLKIEILEADLENYPGMYLDINEGRHGFKSAFARYPLEYKESKGLNIIPVKRADYLAKVNGTRNFPWRAVAISRSDKDLLNNDIVQKLATPPQLEDVSWIQPGQVAWDWWNDWNISHVDFRSGINNETYKYYIDFAAKNNVKYIIMDAGWSETFDLLKEVKDIKVKELVEYGNQKGVGIILWAAWKAVLKQMDTVFAYYSGMGIKGFKIDFFDRDDQIAVASTYEIAKAAARYHLMVDYHGIFKPTGLQRTYPNVIGYEGVRGLENYKWANEDAPRYAVSIPFIRMMAGPMDYTPGAFRNATHEDFHPSNSSPMAQGTRCNQMAMYVVYHAPLQMLSDNPTIYMKEQECTDFITKVPTTFDETVPLDGQVAEYLALARRKGDTWFVGAMTNWTARDLTIDLSFLGEGTYRAIVFHDGINADRDATDYKKDILNISATDKLNIHLAPGGGWTARIDKIK